MKENTTKKSGIVITVAAYALLAFAAMLLHVFGNSKLSFAVIVVGVFALAFDIVSTLILSRKIKAILVAPLAVKKGEDLYFDLIIEKPTFLPAFHIEIQLNFYNLLTGETQSYIVERSEFQKSDTIKIKVTSKTVGALTVKDSSLTLFSAAYSLSKSIPIVCSESALIMPCGEEIKLNFSEGAVPRPVGESYCLHRSGEDTSEIFALREYRGGDALKNVHWKLSSKTDRLIVREFSRPSNSDILLIFNVNADGTNEKSIEEISKLAEAAYNTAFSLIYEGKSFSLLFFDKNEIRLVKADNASALFSAFSMLFCLEVGQIELSKLFSFADNFSRAVVYTQKEEFYASSKITVINAQNADFRELTL